MSMSDKYEEIIHIIKVTSDNGDGSGVLVKINNDYRILTAYHNIFKIDDEPFETTNLTTIHLESPVFGSIDEFVIVEKSKSNDYIIIAPKLKDEQFNLVASFLKLEVPVAFKLKRKQAVEILGYPSVTGGFHKHIDCQVDSIQEDFFTVKYNGNFNSNKNNVSGFSGAGVILNNKSGARLLAGLCKSVLNNAVAFNSIKFIPINRIFKQPTVDFELYGKVMNTNLIPGILTINVLSLIGLNRRPSCTLWIGNKDIIHMLNGIESILHNKTKEQQRFWQLYNSNGTESSGNVFIIDNQNDIITIENKKHYIKNKPILIIVLAPSILESKWIVSKLVTDSIVKADLILVQDESEIKNDLESELIFLSNLVEYDFELLETFTNTKELNSANITSIVNSISKLKLNTQKKYYRAIFKYCSQWIKKDVLHILLQRHKVKMFHDILNEFIGDATVSNFIIEHLEHTIISDVQSVLKSNLIWLQIAAKRNFSSPEKLSTWCANHIYSKELKKVEQYEIDSIKQIPESKEEYIRMNSILPKYIKKVTLDGEVDKKGIEYQYLIYCCLPFNDKVLKKIFSNPKLLQAFKMDGETSEYSNFSEILMNYEI